MTFQNTSKKLETINDIVRLLAYNSHLILGDEKDIKVCVSLAESAYAWTEKQGGLALRIATKYRGIIKKLGLEIDELLSNPVYEEPFRVLSFDKSIEKIFDENQNEGLQIRFPYNEKLIGLIRCLKNKKTQNLLNMRYNGESKVWTMPYNDIVVYYTTLIAVRYNFTICSKDIIKDFEEIQKEKQNHKLCRAKIENGSVRLVNAVESLQEYWNEHVAPLPYIQQVDQLKNFEIPFNRKPVTSLSESMAFASKRDLFIPRAQFTKSDFLQAMQELNTFPAICMIYGNVETDEDLKEFREWLEAIKQAGIAEQELCFGFEKDVKVWNCREDSDDLIRLNSTNRQFNKDTKIIFVRNRIPRSLIKANAQVRSAFMMQDGSY